MKNQIIVLGLLLGLLALPFYFFKRRIGGPGGGSEADAVGALWLLATLIFGLYLARHVLL